jgi:hypothetical protein
MKALLMGILALTSLTVTAKEDKFPMPCELVCNELWSTHFDYTNIFIQWKNDGNATEEYVLVDHGTNVKEFIYNEMELIAKNVSVSIAGAIYLYLPGKKGDVSSLPIEVSELMMTRDELFTRPEFSIKGKHVCGIFAYSLNANSKIETQVLESEVDLVANYDLERPEVKVINLAPGTRVSKYQSMKFQVMTNISDAIPFAKEKLTRRLKELRNIGICKKYSEGR